MPSLAIMPRSLASIDEEQARLKMQLLELAGLRQELQTLYEKTHAELQASRAEAALERGLREAAAADNAALRRWNTQLGEELSALLGQLLQEEDEIAAETAGTSRGAAALGVA